MECSEFIQQIDVLLTKIGRLCRSVIPGSFRDLGRCNSRILGLKWGSVFCTEETLGLC